MFNNFKQLFLIRHMKAILNEPKLAAPRNMTPKEEEQYKKYKNMKLMLIKTLVQNFKLRKYIINKTKPEVPNINFY